MSLGLTGLFGILLSLLGITLAWWALQSFRFDLLVKEPQSPPAKMLMILLAVLLGHSFARFIMDYLSWAQLLSQLLA